MKRYKSEELIFFLQPSLCSIVRKLSDRNCIHQVIFCARSFRGHGFPSQMLQPAFPGGCGTHALPPTATQHPGPAHMPGTHSPGFQAGSRQLCLPGKDDAGRLWKCSFPDSPAKHLPLSSSPRGLSLMGALPGFMRASSAVHGVKLPGQRRGPGTALTNTSKPKSKCKDLFYSTHHRANSRLPYLDFSCDYTTFISSTLVTSPENREIFISKNHALS